MHFNYVSLFVRMSEKSADVTDGSERVFHLVPTFKKRKEEGKTRCSLFKYFTSLRFRMFRKQTDNNE